MRDVIIVGAGGGGAVIAKELACRGLDVLLLEAGPRFAHPEQDWTHFESDANNPATGYFRFGPAARSKPPWVRELAQSMLFVQLAGVGGTTNHYQGNSPRAAPGTFADYEGGDENTYDTAHLFPFSYRDLLPYYEWVEHTLPVATAPMGTKEEIFFRGALQRGFPLETTKDITRVAFRPQQNAILQPIGNAGRTGDPNRLVFPRVQGCTFCGHCSQGCFEPLHAPINLKAKRSTSVSYIPMALTCDLWSPDGQGSHLDCRCVRYSSGHRPAINCAHRDVAYRRQRRALYGGSTRHRSLVRHGRNSALVAEQRLAQSQRLGGPRADRPFRRRSHRSHAIRHGIVERAGFRRADRFSRRWHAGSRGRDARVKGRPQRI